MKIRFRDYIVSFAVSLIGYSIPMIVLFIILYRNFLKALFLGVIAGSIFALGMIITVIVMKKRMKPFCNEFSLSNKVVFSTPANVFKEKKSIGGVLLITEDEIYFHSHKFNIETIDIKILLKDIIDVKNANLINCILVKTKENESIKFAVFNRRYVISIIRKMIS